MTSIWGKNHDLSCDHSCLGPDLHANDVAHVASSWAHSIAALSFKSMGKFLLLEFPTTVAKPKLEPNGIWN